MTKIELLNNPLVREIALEFRQWAKDYIEVNEPYFDKFAESKTKEDWIILSYYTPRHLIHMEQDAPSFIKSVRRESDDEVFTIGDKVQAVDSGIIGNIQSIILEKEELRLIFNTEIYPGGYTIDRINKVKQPLFTTEDGVDIYENGNIYWINLFTLDGINCDKYNDNIGECDLKDGLISLKDFNKSDKSQDISFLGFSSKEKAEEYLVMNKPCLSINEVNSNILWNNPHQWSCMILMEKFVKNKLKYEK